MICHMINITGQILPVKKICEMAHSYGVEVMVDGAHCVSSREFPGVPGSSREFARVPAPCVLMLIHSRQNIFSCILSLPVATSREKHAYSAPDQPD